MSVTCEISMDDILEGVGTLPSLPRAIVEIIRTIEDGNASAETLSRKIEADMGLLTRVLRLVNSSHYARGGNVSSIPQAIVLLGFNEIRNLVCIHGIADYFQKNIADGFDYERFLRHSAGVGCVAKMLTKSASLNPDAAFVAGLLHDVGQLALAATAPNEFRMVMDYKKIHDCTVAEAERAVIGMDHAKIGAHLAKLWHLPRGLCEAIECHHQAVDFPVSWSPMADLIHVAEVLAHAMELGSSEQVPPLSKNTISRLGLTLHQIAQSLGKIEEEYCDFANILGM